MTSLHTPVAARLGATSQPTRPHETIIAFAISVVFSKPEGLSAREYIRLLRQHVAKGSRKDALSSAYRHLDQSSYWRSEYERVNNALRASETEAVDLKREIEALKAKADSTKPAKAAKKRKKPDEDVTPMSLEPKKGKGCSSPPHRSCEIEFEKDFDFVEVGEIGNILIRSLFQAHLSLKNHPRSEPAVLAHHLVCTAYALPEVIQQILEQCVKRSIGGPELLKTNMTAVARAVASLILGINRLSHAGDGADMQGQVIYSYLQMFSRILDTLGLASEAAVKKTRTAEAATGSAGTRPTTSKGKANAHQSKSTGNLKDIPTLNSITVLLCSIINQLDAKLEVHKALFEGFAYSTLNKLGAQLYICVFGHSRSETIESEIAASNLSDEIDDAKSPAMEALEVTKAKLEAPYLIHLLTSLMKAAPEHMGTVVGTKKGKGKTTSTKASMKNSLTVIAKDRLQRTLINCMFGAEGMSEDDEIMDCLKMPTLKLGKKVDIPKVKDAEIQDWFKEEVWRLLGWEILAKDYPDW